MKGRYTVCAAVVKNRINGLVQVGLSPDAIYQILNLAPDNLSDSDARIPIEKLVYLEKAAPALTRCPEVAFKIALECNNSGDSKSGIVGQIAASSMTVGIAFKTAVRYSQLMSDAVHMAIKEYVDKAEFICMRKTPDLYTHFECETAMIDSYNILKRFGDVHEVHFMHEKPSYVKHYNGMFKCKMVFNSPITKIVFAKEILTKENPAAQPYVNNIIRDYADKLLKNINRNNSFSYKIECLISEHISSGVVGIDFVSGKLNMSRQSLYRKLKEEKTSFSILLDNVRKGLAANYIRFNEHSMIEIALLLGFSESSSFNRAYKRGFKKNPKQNKIIAGKMSI